MSELTNIHARAVKDLTTPTNPPADPNALDQVKLVAGNFPAEYAGNEAMTVGLIKELAAEGREAELEEVFLKITQEETRAKAVEDLLSKNKAEKNYVDTQLSKQTQDVNTALSQLSTEANKFYPTLAEANADISNIAVNQPVTVGEAGSNGGLWYKAIAEAPTLTKSAYDPLTQSIEYTRRITQDWKDIAALSDITLSEDDLKYSTLTFTGAMTEDIIVTFPKIRGNWKIRQETTGNKSITLKVQYSSRTVTATNGNVIEVHSNGTILLRVDNDRAPLASPQFTGIPRTGTAPEGTNSTQLATTEFAKRESHGSIYIKLTDDTINITESQCSYKNIVFYGTLTADKTLTLASPNGSWNMQNGTTGGFNLTLKSTNPPTVTIPNRQNAKVWAVGGSVEITQQTLLPATNTTLGGVKVGSGLAVSGDGTLSAIGGGGSSVLTNYRGKFTYEGDYTIGDIVEHGSGIYECVADVTGIKSPQNNTAFLKKSNNLYAGADRKITTIGTEVTSLEGKKPILFTQNGTKVFSNETWHSLFASDDFGETWYEAHNFGGGKVGVVYPLDNGELLVTFEADGTPIIQQIWISTGWGTANCTWENTMSVQRPGVYFASGWSFSNYKNIILLSEYGPKYSTTTSGGGWTNIVGENSRYAYMSLDNGKTWKTIFDLNSLTDGVGVHVHGIVYDEYWQRIWVSHGDGDYGSNGLWYSDDLGDTWVSALQTQGQGRNFGQVVGKFSLPTCLIFVSDSPPNGLYRIDRSQGKYPAKGYYDIDVAYQIPDASQTGLNYLSHSNIKTRFTPDPIWIFSFLPEVLSGKSRILATFNGWEFFELYEDDQVFNKGKGIICVTATAKNEIIAMANDNRFGSNIRTQIKLKVKIE